uniref:Serine protease K12H4.7 n=1 Tax=Rhabditophanes sp. KR3021 TaxID=114890 RepID=A0AC35TZZ6_9BILA
MFLSSKSLILCFAAIICINEAKLLGSNFGRPHKLIPRHYDDTKAFDSIEGTFENKVDHFNSFNKNTYKQRYWQNSRNYKAGGPIFLMVGGEAGENSYWTDSLDLTWNVEAKRHGAMLFNLEHRFYGASQPVNDMSGKNLKLLSSSQALADAVSFIEGMNKKFNYPNGTKWISFGGSYSGALSAWLREMYPEVVYGAVASSAPLTAVVDFYDYLSVVQNSLTAFNAKCGSDLKSALSQVRELTKTKSGQKQIKHIFGLCQNWSEFNKNDIDYFWLLLFNSYKTIVQYSGININDYRTVRTIDNLCAWHLRSTHTPIENIQAAVKWVKQINGEDECTAIRVQRNVNAVSRNGRSWSDNDAWFWQTCNEFGFFQAADRPEIKDFWGDVVSIDYFTKSCEESFGSLTTNSTIYNSVKKTNTQYGGAAQFRGTRVILPNGLVDPWHSLGVLKATNSQNYPLLIKGTSHCEDMYPASQSDPASLTDARHQLSQHLDEWLSLPK